MNRLYKLAVAMCLVSSLLIGCAPAKDQSITLPNNTDTTTQTHMTDSKQNHAQNSGSDSDTSSAFEETGTETSDKLIFIQEFSNLMGTRPSASEIASFMEDNLDTSAPDEADLALGRLILAQEQVRTDWNSMLIDGKVKGYQEMGFEWNPDNITMISDQDMRNDYQSLVDSYTRVMTYEETPVIETDWAKMQQFDPYLSDHANLMIEINKKVQNYEYGAYPHAFADMAIDVIKLETQLTYRQSDFLSYEMNRAYNMLIGEMFYSVEGVNMEYWRDLDGPLLSVLSETAANHPETDYGKLCADFIEAAKALNGSDQFYHELGSIISSHNVFGIQSSLDVEMDVISTKNHVRRAEFIRCPHNTEVERKINSTLTQWYAEARSQYNWTDDSKGMLREGSYAAFANSKYFATNLYSSTTSPDGEYIYNHANFLFDITTGNVMALEDLFRMPYSEYSPVLLQVIKDHYMAENTFFNDLTSLPEAISFYFDEQGLSLQFDKNEISKDYPYEFSAHIPHSALYELYDVIELYE